MGRGVISIGRMGVGVRERDEYHLSLSMLLMSACERVTGELDVWEQS